MKALCFTALMALFTVGAQAQDKAQIQFFDVASPTSGVALALPAFNQTADTLIEFVNIGSMHRCEYAQAVIAMANTVEKSAVSQLANHKVRGAESNLAVEARIFMEHVALAMATNCMAKNNKCCQHSNQADVSDSCNAATNKNCTLTGIRIQGCTTSSDDC